MKLKLNMPMEIDLDSLAWEMGHEMDIPNKTLFIFVMELLEFNDTIRKRVYKELAREYKE